MLRNYTNIGARATLILGVLVFLAYAFVMRSDAAGITFATGSGQGGLEMKIDSRTVYNNVIQPKLSWALKNLKPFCDYFFRFFDVKPGDTGQNTISIHITKNPAWVCLDFLNLKDRDNGNNEPESQEDANGPLGGELSSGLEFFGWMDDGDNTYEIAERILFGTSTQAATTTLRGMSYALADATHGTAFPVNSTRYVGIHWCAGNLQVSTTTGAVSCDGSVLGNGVQTDSMKLAVSLRAVPAKDQKNFTCTRPGNQNSHANDYGDNDDDWEDDRDDNYHDDEYKIEWHEPKKQENVKTLSDLYKKIFSTFRV